jgi:hypothetical protein
LNLSSGGVMTMAQEYPEENKTKKKNTPGST